MTREELLVERITYITKIALGEELNNMLGIEVDKDFNEAILQASIKAAKVGMKFADEHPRWISVEEKLPKVGQSCIILIDRKALQGMPRIRRAVYAPKVMMQQEGFAYNRMSKKHHITHWMPLPSLPSGSEKPNNCEKGGEE